MLWPGCSPGSARLGFFKLQEVILDELRYILLRYENRVMLARMDIRECQLTLDGNHAAPVALAEVAKIR